MGVALGAGLGVVFGNLALGIPIGACLGMGLGLIIAANNKPEPDAAELEADSMED